MDQKYISDATEEENLFDSHDTPRFSHVTLLLSYMIQWKAMIMHFTRAVFGEGFYNDDCFLVLF